MRSWRKSQMAGGNYYLKKKSLGKQTHIKLQATQPSLHPHRVLNQVCIRIESSFVTGAQFLTVLRCQFPEKPTSHHLVLNIG